MSHAEPCFNARSSSRPLSLSLSLALSSFSKSRSLKRFSGADLSPQVSNSRLVKASEANRLTEMMSKTAVKGGKLRSCQHLLFECGRSFESFFEWKSTVVALGRDHSGGHPPPPPPLQSLSVSQESWLWNSVTWCLLPSNINAWSRAWPPSLIVVWAYPKIHEDSCVIAPAHGQIRDVLGVLATLVVWTARVSRSMELS